MKFAELRERNGTPIFVNPPAVAFVSAEATGGARVHFHGGAATPVLAGEAAEIVGAMEKAEDSDWPRIVVRASSAGDSKEPASGAADQSNPDGPSGSGGLPLGGGKAGGAKK